MANFFDQFDPAGQGAPKAPAPAAAGGGSANFFDQFDPTPAPSAPAAARIQGANPGALQIRVGGRQPIPDAGPASFEERVRGDGSAPQRFSDQQVDTPLGRGLRARADEEVIGKPSATNDAIAALIGAGQAASLNAAGNASAGLATFFGKIGVPGYGDGSRTFDENYRRFEDLQGAHGRQSPKSTVAGAIGGALAAAPLTPGLPIAEGANLATRAGLYGLTGGIYGGAAEVIGSHDPTDAISGGAKGLVAGSILGPAIEKLAPPVVNAASKALAPILERFGVGGVRTAQGAFTPEARQALQAAGLDANTLPPALADSLQATFTAKGVSPGAIREAGAGEFAIPLSRGQATSDPAALALEARAAGGGSGRGAQAAAQDFAGRQAEAIGTARDRIGAQFAGSHPVIETPQAAGEGVADAARRIADDAAFRGSVAQRRADQALEAVRGPGIPADTLDAAGQASQGVRDAAARAKAAYRGAYDDVAQIPGSFAPGALDRMGTRMRDRLGPEVPVDDVLTPAATRALSDLDALPGLFGLQPGQGPNLQQVDQLRKRLVTYRGSTGQNPTDRRAMDRILGHFDDHVHDAMDAGLFGQQMPAQAGQDAASAAQGMAGPAATAATPGLGSAAPGKSETLIQYLARNGGIALDGDARAGDLGRIMTPHGPLGRRGGRPIEDFRDQLASEGFLRPDSADGMISRRIGDEVHDLIGIERGGNPVYRLADISRGAAEQRDAGGRVADQSAAYAERLGHFRQQVADDLTDVGIRLRDVDPAHLDDAAARLMRGEHDTGADAFEAAVLGRDLADHLHPAPRGPAAAPAPETPPLDGTGAAGAFPGGDTAPSDAMRHARGLFREYRQAFSQRVPGDVAGRNLQRIVEADATPNEVAGMLFGGATGRVTGRQLETLDRLKAAVGADSDAWRATQQAVIGKYLEGRDVSRSLDYLLNGEGRHLANRVLTREQISGLNSFRTGIRQAEDARASVPGWVSEVARSGYDPNRVLSDLFGAGIPGARPGQAAYGKGLRQYLGEGSPEWSALRQAAWLRLTQRHETGPTLTPKREAERVRAFLTGEGKGLAETMFSPTERALMGRYADTLALTEQRGQVLPDGGRAAKIGGQVLNVIAGLAGAKLGGVPAVLAAYGAKTAQDAARGGLAASAARRSFEGGAPQVAAPLPGYAMEAGRAAGVADVRRRSGTR